jgi:hypothetical protein
MSDFHSSIAILGDTQETTLLERLILFREHNRDETTFLFKKLAELSPRKLFMLGDFVSIGSSKRQWESFDQCILPIRDINIPIAAIPGNHDYWGGGSSLNLLHERFPGLRISHWFVDTDGPIAFVFLDSNRNQLGEKKWQAQLIWLRDKMIELDQSSSIQAIVFIGHHPPYTNSKTTGDHEDSQNFFVPELMKSKKGIAYFSGHAHGFEHFLKEGRHFIVSGGGGGPRVKYLEGKKSRHRDLFQGESPRPFHFLLLQIHQKSLGVSVQGFQKGELSLCEIDRFTINFRV